MEFYTDAQPVGIFVIVNKSYQELYDINVGSVPLSFFTLKEKSEVDSYSRICVSVNHEKFKQFFGKLLK